MTEELVIGVVLLATAAGLMFVGLPNKAGASPRFLRFEAAIVLYPPVVMVFFAGGIAEIVTALLRNPH